MVLGRYVRLFMIKHFLFVNTSVSTVLFDLSLAFATLKAAFHDWRACLDLIASSSLEKET